MLVLPVFIPLNGWRLVITSILLVSGGCASARIVSGHLCLATICPTGRGLRGTRSRKSESGTLKRRPAPPHFARHSGARTGTPVARPDFAQSLHPANSKRVLTQPS